MAKLAQRFCGWLLPPAVNFVIQHNDIFLHEASRRATPEAFFAVSAVSLAFST
jgi:hypothetical protein